MLLVEDKVVSRWVKLRAFERLLSRMNVRSGLALDAGCGGGGWGNLLEERGFLTVEVDIDRAQLIRAKRKCHGHFLRADITLLPFRQGVFDFLACLDVLEHIYDDSAALRELARCLRIGGKAIFSFPMRRRFFEIQRQLFGVDKDFYNSFYEHVRDGYLIEEALDLFKRHGLDATRTAGFFGPIIVGIDSLILRILRGRFPGISRSSVELLMERSHLFTQSALFHVYQKAFGLLMFAGFLDSFSPIHSEVFITTKKRRI